MSLYLAILTEALLSTLWPLKAEVTAEAMRLFGGYDMSQAALFSVIGAWLAVILLWALGRGLQRWLGQRPAVARVVDASANRTFFGQGMGIAAMALVWLPMGFMVAILAGFLRVPVWKIGVISGLGCALYYSSQLMFL